MPELGESVHEGTVSRWLKREGDPVKEDEPIVEIMTDKVNTELPSPASGVLSRIMIPEGGTVEVFHVMGIIDEAGAAVAPAEAILPMADAEPSVSLPAAVLERPAAAIAVENGGRRWYTPVVRAIAMQNSVSEEDLAAVRGTGQGGRVTKKDLEGYLTSVRGSATATQKVQTKPAATARAGTDEELIQMGVLRKMIAESMVRSAAVPTVTTVTQVDVTDMVTFRDRNKDAFLAQHGVKLTYTPFFVKALTETLVEFPMVNSSLQPDMQILRMRGVDVGVAGALAAKGDEGLIGPVIRDCQAKTLVEIAKDLDDVAKRARSNSLNVADVQGATFTLTNPGSYGALFGTPMINAPQSGILGAYAINKMPVIVNDMIAIRSIMHLVLTYDHRLVDGSLAGRFLAAVRDRLQSFDFFK